MKALEVEITTLTAQEDFIVLICISMMVVNYLKMKLSLTVAKPPVSALSISSCSLA